jgi:hypothetical protein
MPKGRKIIGDRKRKDTRWGFTRGAVIAKDRGYVLAFLESLGDERESTTCLLRWDGQKWSSWVVEWNVSSVIAASRPNRRLMAVGPGGRFRLGTPARVVEEEIDTTPNGPRYRGMLRDVRLIGKTVFVAGIGRQVYRRAAPGRWVRADRGVLAPKGKAKGTGFNSIDGFAKNDVYAVGGRGEIWHFNGKAWEELDSPTDRMLERVICAPDGKVYVCGQSGLLLRGRQDAWEAIEHQTTKDDLWGMTWFKDRLWVTTLEAVYSLEADDSLKRSDQGTPALTCGWLDAKDDVMWSVGENDIAYFDGKDWYELILER